MFPIRAIAALAIGLAAMFESWAFMLPDQDPTDVLILVNKVNRAPAVPMTLVLPDVTPTKPELIANIYMRPEAAASLEALFAAAEEEGIALYATSGYRSYSTQKAIYERKLEKVGGNERSANASVAKPGYSEHQTGLAMDVEGETTKRSGLTSAFGESPEGIWLAEHCCDYGFIIRYPKEKTKITGYVYEPWHIRYVGVSAAQEIREMDVTFEEYTLFKKAERVIWLEEGGDGQ